MLLALTSGIPVEIGIFSYTQEEDEDCAIIKVQLSAGTVEA